MPARKKKEEKGSKIAGTWPNSKSQPKTTTKKRRRRRASKKRM